MDRKTQELLEIAYAKLAEVEETAAGIKRAIRLSPLEPDPHNPFGDAVIQGRVLLEQYPDIVLEARRKIHALENPESVVRWEDGMPVLNDETEVLLRLKYWKPA